MADPNRPSPGDRARGHGRPPSPGNGPRLRRGAVRVGNDVAWRVRSGHPWVFRDALGGRLLTEAAGATVDILDPNGTFVARGLVDPEGPIAVRIFSRTPSSRLDGPAILARVERARRLRERFLPAELTALRVVHGEGDGLPGITVDRYADFLVVHVYTQAMEALLPQVHEALQAVWKPRGIYQQHRYRPQTGDGQREPARLVTGELAPVEVEAVEDGLRFVVDVTAPLGTGLFLDLREGRRAVARLAADKRVLNLFSYTGAFSIHAARGGAKEVVSVDLAARSHARARRNLQVNGLGEEGHEFLAGDAIKTLARFVERRRRFDLVVLDPPSFSQAKGAQVFVAQRDYRDLVSAALEVLEPGGLLACASNTAKLPLEEFDRIVGDGAGRGGRGLTIVARHGLPPDFPVPAGFPEGHYLKFFLTVVE